MIEAKASSPQPSPPEEESGMKSTTSIYEMGLLCRNLFLRVASELA